MICYLCHEIFDQAAAVKYSDPKFIELQFCGRPHLLAWLNPDRPPKYVKDQGKFQGLSPLHIVVPPLEWDRAEGETREQYLIRLKILELLVRVEVR